MNILFLWSRWNSIQVEVQTLTELYDAELDRLHDKYQNKLEKLKKVKDDENGEQFQEKLKEAIEERDKEWTEKYNAIETKLLGDQISRAALADSVAKAEAETASLKQSSNQTIFALRNQLSEKQIEVDKITKRNMNFERQLSEERKRHGIQVDQTQSFLQNVQTENEQLK